MLRSHAREARRKLFHVAGCAILLAPLIAPELALGLTPLQFYALAAIITAGVNAWQVKKGLVLDGLRLNTLLEKIVESTAVLPELSSFIARLEENLGKFLRDLEREYEAKSGYVGATFGVLGVMASYALFGSHAMWGILALMVVDPVAALVGGLWGRRRFMANRSLEGSAGAMAVFFASLMALGRDPLSSLIISLAAVLSEAVSLEDNLVIPVCVSAVSFLLG